MKKLMIKYFGLTLVFLTICGFAKETERRNPSFARLTICDVRMGQTAQIHDPRNGYLLISSGDCDGNSLTLTLAPDLRRFGWFTDESSEYKEWVRSFKRATLPRLRTGRGVNIGDTPAQIRRKNGTPGKIERDGAAGEITYTYKGSVFVLDPANSKKRMHGDGEVIHLDESSKAERRNYQGQYIFRGNRLWAMHYQVTETNACGG